jgi:hypothetical protein
MGNDNNSARASQLGMPFGTAQQRLRKAIMFKYVKLAGHDDCFKCGNKIEDIDHLSIEHKLPWQGRDTGLFWDLENIAFSHLSCNRPHTNGSIKLRKTSPIGMAWCGYCKSDKPVTDFWRSDSTWTGLSRRCKKCNNQSKIDYRVDRKK